MKSFKEFYTENMTASSVFGTTGEYGNQFPSQNDSAYAPGDARMPFGVAGKKPKKKNRKQRKQTILRRNLTRVL